MMLTDGLIVIFIVVLALMAGLAVYALRDLLARGGHLLPSSSASADYDPADTATSAMSAGGNNWRWARRIEVDQRIAEAALRKAEAAAINALERDG